MCILKEGGQQHHFVIKFSVEPLKFPPDGQPKEHEVFHI